jgi:hypothetical protein
MNATSQKNGNIFCQFSRVFKNLEHVIENKQKLCYHQVLMLLVFNFSFFILDKVYVSYKNIVKQTDNCAYVVNIN